MGEDEPPFAMTIGDLDVKPWEEMTVDELFEAYPLAITWQDGSINITGRWDDEDPAQRALLDVGGLLVMRFDP